MVESETIKKYYTSLLMLVEIEANANALIREYFNYLNESKQKFMDSSNINVKGELKEFLRAANRYSDEFVFSDEHYSEIRTIISNLYDILNN